MTPEKRRQHPEPVGTAKGPPTSSQELVLCDLAHCPLRYLGGKLGLFGLSLERFGGNNICPWKLGRLLCAIHTNHGRIRDIRMCEEHTLQLRRWDLEALQ